MKMMCLLTQVIRNRNEKYIFFSASLKSMKKGGGSGVGSGSISKRYGIYGSGDSDLDPHKDVTDPQHY
jgi:hypothetical protein